MHVGLLQAAVELGQALLDAAPAATGSARRAQLHAALGDVQAQLEQLEHVSGGSHAASGPAVATQSSAAAPDQTVSQAAAAGLSSGTAVKDDDGMAGTAGLGSIQPAVELTDVTDGGWAARRAAAGAQQRDSLLQRQMTAQVVSPAAQQREHGVPLQHRPSSNGHLHDLAERENRQRASAPSNDSTAVSSSRPGAESQQAAIAALNGHCHQGAAVYTAQELRQLRVASARLDCEFDAASLGDDLRKPPDMVPGIPPPAEDPPA